MSSEIVDALRSWAERRTWFSSHPNDQYYLNEAISCLKTLPFRPTAEEIELEIIKIVQHHPPVIGGPDDLSLEVKRVTREIVSKL